MRLARGGGREARTTFACGVKIFMACCRPMVKQSLVIALLAAKARPVAAARAMPLVAHCLVAQNRPTQAKRKRLGPAIPARRWDRLALAFFALARQLSIPWRD